MASIFPAVRDRVFKTFEDEKVSLTFALPAGGYDPITGTSSPPVTFPADGFRLSFNLGQFDGQAIKTGDLLLLVSADDFVTYPPDTSGMSITLDGIDYQIVNVISKTNNYTFNLQVRKL